MFLSCPPEADLLEEEEDELGAEEEEEVEDEGNQEGVVRLKTPNHSFNLASVNQVDGDPVDGMKEEEETGGEEQVTQTNEQHPAAAQAAATSEEKTTNGKPSSTSAPQSSVQPTKLSDTEVGVLISDIARVQDIRVAGEEGGGRLWIPI